MAKRAKRPGAQTPHQLAEKAARGRARDQQRLKNDRTVRAVARDFVDSLGLPLTTEERQRVRKVTATSWESVVGALVVLHRGSDLRKAVEAHIRLLDLGLAVSGEADGFRIYRGRAPIAFVSATYATATSSRERIRGNYLRAGAHWARLQVGIERAVRQHESAAARRRQANANNVAAAFGLANKLDGLGRRKKATASKGSKRKLPPDDTHSSRAASPGRGESSSMYFERFPRRCLAMSRPSLWKQARASARRVVSCSATPSSSSFLASNSSSNPCARWTGKSSCPSCSLATEASAWRPCCGCKVRPTRLQSRSTSRMIGIRSSTGG